MKLILTVRLQTRVDCVRYFKTNQKKGNEKHAAGKYLELIAGDGWADIILQLSDGWRSYIWSVRQQEIWLRLPSAANRYLGLHKTRVGSAKAESPFENGAGSTDLGIATSFVFCQPCNDKDGKIMKKGRRPQQSCALDIRPCWAARLLSSTRAVSSSTSPNPIQEY